MSLSGGLTVGTSHMALQRSVNRVHRGRLRWCCGRKSASTRTKKSNEEYRKLEIRPNTWGHHSKYNTINWRDTTYLDSEESRTGCRNISQCQQQQSYSGLRLPGRWNSTCFWNDYWIQTFHMIISGRKGYSWTSRYGHLSNTDSSLLRTVSNFLTKFSYIFFKKASIIPTLSNSRPQIVNSYKLNLFITDTTVIRCRCRIPIRWICTGWISVLTLFYHSLYYSLKQFVRFLNLRIILFMGDLGTHLKSWRKKIKGRQFFQHH